MDFFEIMYFFKIMDFFKIIKDKFWANKKKIENKTLTITITISSNKEA